MGCSDIAGWDSHLDGVAKDFDLHIKRPDSHCQVPIEFDWTSTLLTTRHFRDILVVLLFCRLNPPPFHLLPRKKSHDC
jgi:hypothetical protein